MSSVHLRTSKPSGTLLPTAILHVVNQSLSPEVYQTLTIGFDRALDTYLHSGRFHSRAAVLQKWFNAPTGLSGLLGALRGYEMRIGCTIDEHYVPWWVEAGREEKFLDATPYVRAIWM